MTFPPPHPVIHAPKEARELVNLITVQQISKESEAILVTGPEDQGLVRLGESGKLEKKNSFTSSGLEPASCSIMPLQTTLPRGSPPPPKLNDEHHKSLPFSLCLYVYPHFVARQRLYNHVLAATTY
jgi:hypothetical protein